jgi:hypothetical protein
MPQVVAVQLDQIEGIEKDALVGAVVTDEIENQAVKREEEEEWGKKKWR